MKRNCSVCLVLVMFTSLLLTPAASIAQRPENNSKFKFRTITIRHKTIDDPNPPWIEGQVSPKAIWLLFTVEFDASSQVPASVLLRVELRRLCRLPGSGGHFLLTRFQDYFTHHQEVVTVKDRMAEIKVKVHCAGCPHPQVCRFPDGDLDKDGDEDHLGEGPYEALLNATDAPADPMTDLTKLTTSSTQLVHSKYFSTCIFQCPISMTTEGGAKEILAPKAKLKKKK